MRVEAVLIGSGAPVLLGQSRSNEQLLRPLVESVASYVHEIAREVPRSALRGRPFKLGSFRIRILPHSMVRITGELSEPLDLARERHEVTLSYSRIQSWLERITAEEKADRDALNIVATSILLGGDDDIRLPPDIAVSALEVALQGAYSTLAKWGVLEIVTPHFEMSLATSSRAVYLRDTCAAGSSWHTIARQIVHDAATPSRIVHAIILELLRARGLPPQHLERCEVLIIPEEVRHDRVE